MNDEVVELDRISDYPAYWAARHPQRPAMVLGEARLDYRELAALVDRGAKALLSAGLQHGDRVAMLSTPRPEALAMFLSVARIGGLFMGLNPRFKHDELHYVLHDAAPRLLISMLAFDGRDYRSDIERLEAECPFIERIVGFPDAAAGRTDSLERFLAGADGIPDDRLRAAAGTVRERDPCLLVYTSGSTGQPKGAMIPHVGLSHCSRNQCDHWWATPLRVLDNMPLSNMFCVGDLFCFCLVGGGTTVFMEKFDPKGVLETIEREKVTLWGQVPTMQQLVLAHPDFAAHDLSSLQTIFWAGARAPRELIERLGRIAPRLGTNYGLTETIAGVTYTDRDASLDVLAETAGRPDPRYELRVVGSDGRALADDEPGEIQIRGRCQMIGYWNRPEATAAMLDQDGWLRSGDLGFRRPDGNYQLVGRLSEMFKSGGYNIYPREIEMVLEAHPSVAMAAVIGVPDRLYGEVGNAYLLLEPGARPDEAAIVAWCRERLANFKVPKRFVMREDLPMLPVGKIDKVALWKEAVQ